MSPANPAMTTILLDADSGELVPAPRHNDLN
jgi:hypothetical protein